MRKPLAALLLGLFVALPTLANVSILQEKASQNAGAGTTQATTLTSTTAGDAVNCYVISEAFSTTVGVADTHNTYTASAPSPLTDVSADWYLWTFTAPNINGGSLTITATASAGNSSTPLMIYCEEIGDPSVSPVDGQNAATQSSAGTPISSGNATNSHQPALISGFAWSGNNQGVGTGFTQTAVWTSFSGVTYQFLTENQRIAGTGSQAATFTQTMGYIKASAFITMFDEKTLASGSMFFGAP